MWKSATRASQRFLGRSGQATAEYVIATAGAVLAAYIVLQTFEQWLAWFYYDATAVISLPIP